MRAYALVEIGDSQAVDVFVRKRGRFQGARGAITDEPDWAGTFFVAPIDLDQSRSSEN